MAAATWGDELKSYERERRRVIDEGFLRGPPVRLSKGAVQFQERVFDPLLQRFRDPGIELKQRTLEEKERVAHLNRAQDIDIMRSQPFNIVTQASKLEALAPGQDPMRLGGSASHPTLGESRRVTYSKWSHPTTCTDFNIISNLPSDVQHWQRPDERPRCKEREPEGRKVPHWTVKDFDIVTNRYLVDHDIKDHNHKRLNLLEATHKYQKHNRFDPLSQQFTDPRMEERVRTALDALDVERTLRVMPPSYQGLSNGVARALSHGALPQPRGAGRPVWAAPAAPAIPGTPSGSIFSRPRGP